MTREEEISKVALEYANEELMAAPYDAFMAGAEWADQHPHWISVEEELPPRFSLNPSVSMNVLTYGLRTIVSWYYYDKDVWAGNTEVTHWMPLPQAPLVTDLNKKDLPPVSWQEGNILVEEEGGEK